MKAAKRHEFHYQRHTDQGPVDILIVWFKYNSKISKF